MFTQETRTNAIAFFDTLEQQKCLARLVMDANIDQKKASVKLIQHNLGFTKRESECFHDWITLDDTEDPVFDVEGTPSHVIFKETVNVFFCRYDGYTPQYPRAKLFALYWALEQLKPEK